MPDLSPDELQQRKQVLREQAHARRNAQDDKDGVSERIMAKFLGLPEYAAAKTVKFYIDVRAEVRTRLALPAAIASGKKVVVPWCNALGELTLFHLESMDELAIGMYRILEPKPELRDVPAKQVQPTDLDLVMVPGVAFDVRGG